jgi:hypothetical protein
MRKFAELYPSFGKNRDINQKEWKHTPKQMITIPQDKFVWRSALAVTGFKMKIWKKRGRDFAGSSP